MSKTAMALGCILLGASAGIAAASGSNGAIILNTDQMDGITAGSVSFGEVPLASVLATATATGSYTHAVTGVKSLVTKTESNNLPGIGNTYGTFTSGGAIALGVGEIAVSQSTDVSTTNEQPFARVLGGSRNVTSIGIHTKMSHSTTAYYGGAWLTYYLNQIRR